MGNLRRRQQNRHSIKFRISDGFAPGAYALRLVGDECMTHTVNAPVVRWIQGNEGSSATTNGFVLVQGESLRIGRLFKAGSREKPAKSGIIIYKHPQRTLLSASSSLRVGEQIR